MTAVLLRTRGATIAFSWASALIETPLQAFSFATATWKLVRNCRVALAIAFAIPFAALRAEEELPPGQETLPPLAVTALRGSSMLPTSTFEISTFDADQLRRSPYWTTDDFLRQLPGFSLFRRTSSLVANPTTQGASLRGIGPSGASRSLVLFDGIPLNDAFGGWVHWSQINLRHAERIEVVRGGGSAAWGNTALGGVIQIVPRRPEPHTLESQFT